MISCDSINEVLDIANVTIDANLIMTPKSNIQTLTTSIVNTAIGIDEVNSRNEEFVNNILTVDNITVRRSFLMVIMQYFKQQHLQTGNSLICFPTL